MNLLLKIYKNYFPKRQLLIRQNGEVKYVNIIPSLQLILASVLCISFIWLSYASITYFSLNKKILLSNENLQQSQLHLNNLSLRYQLKYDELNQKILKLDQQQQFLQNLLDSMPASVSPNNPLVEEIKARPVSDIKVNSADINTSIFNMMQQIQQQLTGLTQAQQHSFTQLEKQITERKNTLTQALALSGVSAEMLKSYHVLPTFSQGGPLYGLFNNSPAAHKGLTDKLIELNELELVLSNIPVSLPAKKYYISSLYGYRKDPLNNKRAMHKGIDMAGWPKTKIFSPANGTVKRAGRNGSYGNFIEIDHLNGFTTRYGHLNKINVKAGQRVIKNELIGLMGNTGRSTSTHLHYEITFNHKTINPLKLTKALEHVL